MYISTNIYTNIETHLQIEHITTRSEIEQN
jgi:hypothetical protein